MALLNTLFFKLIKLTKKRTVKVPSWITHIPSEAFANLSNLQEVYFNGEISEIQDNAFRGCTSLKKVVFSMKADNISDMAFDNTDSVSFIYSYSIPADDLARMQNALKKKGTDSVESDFIPEDNYLSDSDQFTETKIGIPEKEILSEETVPVSAPETDVINVEEVPAEDICETEPADKQMLFERFDEIIPYEKTSEEHTSSSKRNKTNQYLSKEQLRKTDQKKYSGTIPLSDIKSDDKLISQLIDRYTLLQNRYSGKFPLGLIDISKEEFSSIVFLVRKYIVEKSTATVATRFISSLFLVKTVENCSTNGDFWKTAAELLKCSERETTLFLKEALLSFCSSEKLYFHYYNNRHSYRGTVMIHAVIGTDELNNTLDLLKQFYIEEMFESYSEDTISGHTDYLINAMTKDIENESGENAGISGLYRVSFNFKNACREFPDAVTDILKCLLFNMNAYYHRLSDISYSPPVFYKYFKRWYINDLIKSRKAAEKKKKTIRNSENRTRQIERLGNENKCSFFIDENYELYLFVPKLKVPSEMAEKSIITKLYNGTEPVSGICIENEVVGIFRFHTSEQVIKLDRFYNDLNIKTETDEGETIFVSHSQLSRRFLVFDSDLTEIIPKKIPDNRFYILTDESSEFFADDNYNSYQKSNYFIHSLDVEKECDITVDSQIVFRNSCDNTDISLSADRKYRCRNAKVYVEGIEYSVFTEFPKINIKSDNDAAADYIIDLNEYHIDISDVIDDGINISSYTDRKYVNISLRKKGSMRHICELNIAVFSGFEFTLDKEFYYGENSAELLDIYADGIDFKIQDYPCKFAVTRSRTITLDADDSGTEISFVIKLPVIYWEINEEFNSIAGAKYIPAAKISTEKVLLTDMPFNDIKIMAVNEKVSRQLTISNHKSDISDFHNSVSDYTTFGMYSSKIRQLKMFEIIYKPSLREVSVLCNDRQLIISFYCIGKCPLQIIIKNDIDNQVFTKNYSGFDDGNVTFSEDLSGLTDGIYNVELYIISSDSFGFSKSMELEGTYRIVNGSPFEVFIAEHRYEMKPEYCFFDNEKKQRIQNFYCGELHKPDAESEIYSANAFFYTRNGDRIYLKNANPLRIELLEKKDGMLTFTMTDRDNDGLLYERARGYLINDSSGLKDYNSYALPDHYAIKI